MFAALRLLISSMWHKSLAFFPALISGWVLFNLLFFPCFCMLWFSSCLANNRLSLSVFVICFRAIKQKLMNFKPSKNTMCPINPQRRSQQIINQHKPNTYTNCLFFFFRSKKRNESCWNFSTNKKQNLHIPENAEMPSDCSCDTLLCKQCQVSHTSPTHPPDKTDSASHIPSTICPKLWLHLVSIGCSDRVWTLVISNSQQNPQNGMAAATTEKRMSIPQSGFSFGRVGFVLSATPCPLCYPLSCFSMVFHCHLFSVHIGTYC